jgi:RNA-dependent RNA polymerase
MNWLVLADQSQEGILDKNCIELARLHSDAVDYPKSGNPIALNKIPKPLFAQRPDWNAPETGNPNSDRYYESKRAIGCLSAVPYPFESSVEVIRYGFGTAVAVSRP